MTPLALIKEGITKGDFSLVAEGYNTLTGEKVKAPPQAIPYFVVDFANQVFAKMNGVAEETVEKLKTPKKKKEKAKPPPAMEDDLVRESRYLSLKAPPKQRRPPFQLVKCRCEKCSRDFEVHPDLARNGEDMAFICDDCTTRPTR